MKNLLVKNLFWLFILILLFPFEVLAENKVNTDQIDQSNFANIAILQGLDKITGRSSQIKIKIGQEVRFGKLSIIMHKCWKSPADQRPENKILLEIYEDSVNKTENNSKDKNGRNRIFYGWIFSSSPSISGLEHPVYDITALKCTN